MKRLILANPSEQSPEAVLPPRKPFLSPDALDEVWNERGMKYRIDEFHSVLIERGLGVYVDRPMFRSMIFSILEKFLVEGEARRDPRYAPIPRFPRVQ